MENSMEVPQKIKNRITKRSRNSPSKYTSEGNEITKLKKYLHSHIHCSIIHNSQDMEENIFQGDPLNIFTHTCKQQNFRNKTGPYFLQSILIVSIVFYSIPFYFVADSDGPDSLNGLNSLLMSQTQESENEPWTFRAWKHEPAQRIQRTPTLKKK